MGSQYSVPRPCSEDSAPFSLKPSVNPKRAPVGYGADRRMHNRQLRASWSSDFKVQVRFLIGFRVRAGGGLGSGAKLILLLAFGSWGPLAHRPCSGSIAIGCRLPQGMRCGIQGEDAD